MDTKILSGHDVQIVEICEEVEAAAKVMLQADGIQPNDPAYPQRLYARMTTRYGRLLSLPERQRDRDHILSARQIHLQQGVPGHTWSMQPPLIQAPLQPSAGPPAVSSPSVHSSMQPPTGNRALPPSVVSGDIQQAPAHYAAQHLTCQATPISHAPASASAGTNTRVPLTTQDLTSALSLAMHSRTL